MYIYKDYTYEDVLYDKPCYVEDCGNIYPVSIKNSKILNKNSMYFIFGENHLKIKDETKLLPSIVSLAITYYIEKENYDPNNEEVILNRVINDLEDVFSIVARDKVKLKDFNRLEFSNDKNNFAVNFENFNVARKIILNQNLLHEVKVYENELTAKWAEKVKKARSRKNKNIEMEDIVNLLRNELKISYKEINNMNILQFNYDYIRIIHKENYNRALLYSLVASDVPQVDFEDNLLSKLIKHPDEGLFIDSSKSKLSSVFN